MPPTKYWYPNGPRWWRDSDTAHKNMTLYLEIRKLPEDQQHALALHRISGHGIIVAAEKMGMEVLKYHALLQTAERALEGAIFELRPDATEYERQPVRRGQTNGGEWGSEFFDPEIGHDAGKGRDGEKPELGPDLAFLLRAVPTLVQMRSKVAQNGETKALSDPVPPHIWEHLRRNFHEWRQQLYTQECTDVRLREIRDYLAPKKAPQAEKLATEFAEILTRNTGLVS